MRRRADAAAQGNDALFAAQASAVEITRIKCSVATFNRVGGYQLKVPPASLLALLNHYREGTWREPCGHAEG